MLDAYLMPDQRERQLRIAEDPHGVRPWRTAEQRAQAQAEQALQREHQAQQRAEDALRRIAELEAELAKRER